VNIERIHVAAGPAGLFAIGDIVTYRGKLKLILSGFAEAAAAHAIFPLVHRGEALHFEHSTTKGVPAAS
jgi:thioredoxin reductase (NADPH)